MEGALESAVHVLDRAPVASVALVVLRACAGEARGYTGLADCPIEVVGGACVSAGVETGESRAIEGVLSARTRRAL